MLDAGTLSRPLSTLTSFRHTVLAGPVCQQVTGISTTASQVCMYVVNTVCIPKIFTASKFAHHSSGVPALIKSIPAGIPQLSDPSRRYSRNIHTHTHGKPVDSAGFPPSPSPCTPLVLKKKKRQWWKGYAEKEGFKCRMKE